MLKRNFLKHVTIQKKFIALFFLLFIGVIFFTAFTEKQASSSLTKSFCLEKIKEFQSQLDTLQKDIDAKKDKSILINRFKDTRYAFKRFEFLMEYVDNARYPFFNGANAIEMDDGAFNPEAKPEGLQVIESELYQDSLDYIRLTQLVTQLKYRTLAFYSILRNVNLRDTYIFEAMRFNLIRIEALSLVSFDSPDMRNNVAEINVSLHTLLTIIHFYKEDKNAALIHKTETLIKTSISYLKPYSFSTLDRLIFIKKNLQPITAELLQLQQNLSIPFLFDNEKAFRAVNLNVANIYDSNFINVRFYAPDKLNEENKVRIALGKKLFFDTQLSSNGKLSCASCHLPSANMADGLTTSITNKSGEFQERNTPSILNTAFQSAFFYDLAATSLENQIVNVVANPKEFNHNYDTIIAHLSKDTVYLRLFAQAFPQYKYDIIAPSTINAAIADYERKFVFLNSPFDKYMRGESKTIAPSVARGFNLFMGKAQCGSCHFAPTFFGTAPPYYGVTESEVLGITKTFDTIHPILDEDIGLFKNIQLEDLKYSIKTSTVRNIELTAPYMHNGGFKTLEEVIEFYEHGGGAGMGLNIPNQTLQVKRLQLTNQDKKDIISFMKALTDTTGLKNLL